MKWIIETAFSYCTPLPLRVFAFELADCGDAFQQMPPSIFQEQDGPIQAQPPPRGDGSQDDMIDSRKVTCAAQKTEAVVKDRKKVHPASISGKKVRRIPSRDGSGSQTGQYLEIRLPESLPARRRADKEHECHIPKMRERHGRQTIEGGSGKP